MLQREAWEQSGAEACAVGYLMSDTVQNEFRQIFEASTASSLDIERKHAHDKQFQTTKVTGCARASRNSIIARYHTWWKKVLHQRLWPRQDAEAL